MFIQSWSYFPEKKKKRNTIKREERRPDESVNEDIKKSMKNERTSKTLERKERKMANIKFCAIFGKSATETLERLRQA